MKYRALRSNKLSFLFILAIGWLCSTTSVYACDPNLFCIMIYDPVCGTDGQTYSNSCMAEKACVDVAYPGVCRTAPPACQDLDNDNFSPDGGNCGPIDCNDQDPTINPDMACLAIYDPVCGVDGNTYSNSCEALRACVTVDYPGECVIPPICTDNDQDGFSPEGNGCGPIDCNDNESDINPGVMCTQEYAPVCGVDGNTYGNACVATQACVDIAHEGECGTAITPVGMALYSSGQQTLFVFAMSQLGQEDEISVEGFGQMRWNEMSNTFVLDVRGLAPDQVPATLTLIGSQGRSIVEVTMY